MGKPMITPTIDDPYIRFKYVPKLRKYSWLKAIDSDGKLWWEKTSFRLWFGLRLELNSPLLRDL